MGRYLALLLLLQLMGIHHVYAQVDHGNKPKLKELVFVVDMSPPMAGAVLDSLGKYQYSANNDHRQQVAEHVHSIINGVDTSEVNGYYINFVTFSNDILAYRYFARSDTGLFEAHRYIDSLMNLPPAQFTKKTSICRMLDLLPEYIYDVRGGASVYFYLASSQQAAYGSMGSMCLASEIRNYCEEVYWKNIEHYWILLDNFLTPTQQYNITYACYNHAIIPYQGIDKPLKQIVDIRLTEKRFIVNVRNDSAIYKLPVIASDGIMDSLRVDSLKAVVITNWHPQVPAMPEQVSLHQGQLHFRFRNMLADTVLLKEDGRFMGMIKLLNYQDENYYYNFVADTIQMELRGSEPGKVTLWPLSMADGGVPDTVLPETRLNIGEGTIGDTLIAYLPVQFNKKAIEERAIVYFKVWQENGYKLDTSELLVHVNNYQRHWIFELDAYDYDEGINYIPLKFVVNGPIGKKKILTVRLDKTENLDGGVWLLDNPMANNDGLALELNTYYYPLAHLSWVSWLVSAVLLGAIVFFMWWVTIHRPVFSRGYLYFYTPELPNPTIRLRYKHSFAFSSLGLPTGHMQVSRYRVKEEDGSHQLKAVLWGCPEQFQCLVNGQLVEAEYFLQNFDEVIVLSPDTGKELLRFVYNHPNS